jgi:hypothetical protein
MLYLPSLRRLVSSEEHGAFVRLRRHGPEERPDR